MNNSQILPSIIGSIFLGMVFHKIYMKNDEKKIERFVSHPLVNNATKVNYNTSSEYDAEKEATAFYKVNSIPAKKPPSDLDADSVPLPTPADGTKPPAGFVSERPLGFYYGARRGLGDGDPIRGDLRFEEEPICKMFNFTTIDKKRLNPGFINNL